MALLPESDHSIACNGGSAEHRALLEIRDFRVEMIVRFHHWKCKRFPFYEFRCDIQDFFSGILKCSRKYRLLQTHALEKNSAKTLKLLDFNVHNGNTANYLTSRLITLILHSIFQRPTPFKGAFLAASIALQICKICKILQCLQTLQNILLNVHESCWFPIPIFYEILKIAAVQSMQILKRLRNAVKRIFSCKLSFWYSR